MFKQAKYQARICVSWSYRKHLSLSVSHFDFILVVEDLESFSVFDNLGALL